MFYIANEQYRNGDIFQIASGESLDDVRLQLLADIRHLTDNERMNCKAYIIGYDSVNSLNEYNEAVENAGEEIENTYAERIDTNIINEREFAYNLFDNNPDWQYNEPITAADARTRCQEWELDYLDAELVAEYFNEFVESAKNEA